MGIGVLSWLGGVWEFVGAKTVLLPAGVSVKQHGKLCEWAAQRVLPIVEKPPFFVAMESTMPYRGSFASRAFRVADKLRLPRSRELIVGLPRWSSGSTGSL